MTTKPYSKEPENGRVRVTGVRGEARFVRSKLSASVVDNGDGTIDIVLPPGMQPGEGHYVVWADDEGEHSTACVLPETSTPSIEEKRG